MDGMCATSNFARMSVNADDLSTEDRTFESLKEAREFLTEDRAMEESEHVMKDRTEEVKEVERVQVDRENMDEDLKHQLERLWKTDFEGSLVETKVCPSVEDKKALQIMEKTTLNEYLEKGYAEKIPQEQLDMENRPIWYLPHHPVTHPLKPEKVRVVYDGI
jgi:hypothetical protein